MAQDRERPAPLRPEESINTVTAQPADQGGLEIPIGEADVVAAGLDYGEMNEEDARESGYIGDDGKATH